LHLMFEIVRRESDPIGGGCIKTWSPLHNMRARKRRTCSSSGY
jgi:hypothetical protein